MGVDLIILITYVACIAAAMARIINSFNDEYTVKLDGNALKEQLQVLELQDFVDISFGFDKRYEYGKNDKLNKLGITVKNKAAGHSVYVDWDYCILTDLQGKARRVIRLVPGNSLDLSQLQVFSVATPETSLKESLTAEDCLKREEAKKDGPPVAFELQVNKPLLDFESLKKAKDDGTKKKMTRFLATQTTLSFSLDVAVRIVGPARAASDRALIRCRFIIQKLPWQAGLPWNPR